MDIPLSTTVLSYEKLISVIIPVYNTAEYLDTCLESLRLQTYKSFEAIIVDDGSDDNSKEICTVFAILDSRFIYTRTKHQGIAAARNTALSLARGELIAFIDSDDSIKPDYLESMFYGMTTYGADISVCSRHELADVFYTENTPYRKRGRSRFLVMDSVSALEKLLYQKGVDNSLWCKLWRAELFHGIRFPDGRLYEDFPIVYKLFARAKSVCFTNYKAYNYLLRRDSEVRRKFVSGKMDLIDSADDMLAFINKNYPELGKAVTSRIIRANFHIYMQIPDEDIYKGYDNRIEQNIIKHRTLVLADRRAALRTKAALLLTYPGFVPFRLLRRKIQKGIRKAADNKKIL